MKKHKGQSVVEFALVLPLFLFILFGIIYSGMMFHDYATLSNIARAITREAAVRLGNLMTKFYTPVGSDPISIVKTHDEANGDIIQTTINMQLNVNGLFLDMILPKAFGVQYYMRKEPNTSSST